jgi:hypothetical protein
VPLEFLGRMAGEYRGDEETPRGRVRNVDTNREATKSGRGVRRSASGEGHNNRGLIRSLHETREYARRKG